MRICSLSIRILSLSALALGGISFGPALLAKAADATTPDAGRERILFNSGWRFQKGDPANAQGVQGLSYANLKPWLLPTGNALTSTPAEKPVGNPGGDVSYAQPGFDDGGWRKLDLPHDWGIEGPFKQEYPGETGKLPWWGVAWYRKHFDLPASEKGRQIYLDIEGAMSYSAVWCNGHFAGGWPYGYSSYQVDLTPYIRFGGQNVVAIRLDNPPDSSRWYPGGGIYRDVWLVSTSPVHVAHWGTEVTTPEVSRTEATVKVETTIENDSATDAEGQVSIKVFPIVAQDGTTVLAREPTATSIPAGIHVRIGAKATLAQTIPVKDPALWSVASPNLYMAVTEVTLGGKLVDRTETTFGIRKIEFSADKGFMLNGERIPIKGVCMHHDLGALGAAFNVAAARWRLKIMKEMGVNAIRMTHNPPAPELLDLCDEMGFLVMDEAFDCWRIPKKPNGYNLLFDDWAERDLRAMLRRDRNHPSIILWSVGNEIPEQGGPEGRELAQTLVKIVHEEDATRPATTGCSYTPAGFSGFQKAFDAFGYNYRGDQYGKFHDANPTIPIFGSETGSTISSRGEYFFPVAENKSQGKADFQVSSYDLYAPPWAWPPDYEFRWLDEHPMALGQFIWTGIDYLGEPTPYSTDQTNVLNLSDPAARARMEKELKEVGKYHSPSRSSYFGAVDLAGFKKDLFYAYQAIWRPDLPMAHILPHWNWAGREGMVTPVHVFTSGDEAELFLNGKSLGRKKRGPLEYRLRWDDVKYEPGELKVVAYKNGKHWAEDLVHTTGPAEAIVLQPDRTTLHADGNDLAFVEAMLADKDGSQVPTADNVVTWEVSGPAEIVATDAGDATSHEPFQTNQKKAFNGLIQAIVRTKSGEAGPIHVRATSPGLKDAEVTLQSITP
jgi:beta-galactosidase